MGNRAGSENCATCFDSCSKTGFTLNSGMALSTNDAFLKKIHKVFSKVDPLSKIIQIVYLIGSFHNA